MIQNYGLQLLAGGFSHCDASWGKGADGWDHCFKVYFPVRGEACVVMDGAPRILEAGRIYFLCGYRIERQFCRRDMDIYWVHFIPTSLQLHRVLRRIKPLHAWDARELEFMKSTYTQFNHLFKHRDEEVNELAPDCPTELPCMTCSILLYLIGDLLRKTSAGDLICNDLVYQRLRPSIEYMETHYKINPALKRIAARSHLTPNYYHRLFTEAFGITPFAYMLKRRLDTARQLLSNTVMTVKEVAKQVGYQNEYYFSRMFKKQFGISPSEVRVKRRIG